MSTRHFDRAEEDFGNVLNMEHINLTVPDQQLAALFYVTGLGFTRDPYIDFGTFNMWINVGEQQFHLPKRGRAAIPRAHRRGGSRSGRSETAPRLHRPAHAGHRVQARGEERPHRLSCPAPGVTTSAPSARVSAPAWAFPSRCWTCRPAPPTASPASTTTCSARRRASWKTASGAPKPAWAAASGLPFGKPTPRFRPTTATISRSTSRTSRAPHAALNERGLITGGIGSAPVPLPGHRRSRKRRDDHRDRARSPQPEASDVQALPGQPQSCPGLHELRPGTRRLRSLSSTQCANPTTCRSPTRWRCSRPPTRAACRCC